MKRIRKILVYAVASLVVLAAAILVTAQVISERKAHRKIPINIGALAGSGATPEQGQYLFETRGCAGCHDAGGAGRELINDPGGLYVRTPNITRGANSVVTAYGDADWVRSIRHGVKPNGEPLLIMPSEDYNRLTDDDTTSLIAYLRSLPPLDGASGEIRLPLVLKVLYAFGGFRDAAEKIDHTRAPPMPVAVAATVEHGAYVAQMCIGCHGPGLSGGRIPGTPPNWPPAANLKPGSGSSMGVYDTLEKFAAMMRNGKRPDGSDVSKVMPFESLKKMTDVDLHAVHRYLQTLPARDSGNR